MNSADDISQRLGALRNNGEVISPIEPELLSGGNWWTGSGPEPLRAGILEPKKGYRFRPENVVLAQLLPGINADRVVELGAGSGSLLLTAHYFLDPDRLVAVEYQQPVAERLERSLKAHKLNNAEVVSGDLRTSTTLESCRSALGGQADLVVMNPPFFPSGWGQPSANDATRRSTHAEHGDVADFFASARRILQPKGHLLAVYDAGRLAELLVAATAVGLGATQIVNIPDQRPGRGGPFRVWVRFQSDGGLELSKLGT